MHKPSLIEQINHWKQQFKQPLNHILRTPFAAHIFKERNEPLSYYFNEIDKTVHALMATPEQDVMQAQYLSERLLNQCNALQNALKTKSVPLSAEERRQKAWDRLQNLPPKPRLAAFQKAQQQLLKEKANLERKQSQAESLEQRQHIQQQLAELQRRLEKADVAITSTEREIFWQCQQA